MVLRLVLRSIPGPVCTFPMNLHGVWHMAHAGCLQESMVWIFSADL